MARLYAEVDIDAPVDRVWQTLLNKEKWLYWNTFLYDGDRHLPIQQGQKVFLWLRRLPQEEETEFRAKIVFMQPEACLKWHFARFGWRCEYSFELQAIDCQRTKYLHLANFSAIIPRRYLLTEWKKERRGMQRMARELKHYLETTQPEF